MEEAFFEAIDSVLPLLDEIDKQEIVRIVSHHDTDGMCAAALLVKLFSLENIPYSVTLVPSLRAEDIEHFSQEKNKIKQRKV